MTPVTGTMVASAAPLEAVVDAAAGAPVPVGDDAVPEAEDVEETGGRVEAAAAREAEMALLAGAAALQNDVT